MNIHLCIAIRPEKRRVMEKLGSLRKACIILLVCMAAAIAAPAQTFTTLHSFDGTDGSAPSGLIQAPDGNFYGTTAVGGGHGYGTVFKITLEGTLTTLYGFDSTDGGVPAARLIQATDGNFYGTTSDGGASRNCLVGCGTVFQITPEGVLTTLHSFDSTDGVYPVAKLVQATDGNFYGTTGGAYSNCASGQFSGCGTVFKITRRGGADHPLQLLLPDELLGRLGSVGRTDSSDRRQLLRDNCFWRGLPQLQARWLRHGL